jgi:hypothetical protein
MNTQGPIRGRATTQFVLALRIVATMTGAFGLAACDTDASLEEDLAVSRAGLSAADCPPGTNVIQGTAGDDVLFGTNRRDCILGLGGNDVIDGRGGDDFLVGGDGDDTISGSAGGDTIFGERGNDVLIGEAGPDRLDGGDGDDVLLGEDGADTLRGGNGNDLLDGADGSDDLGGGGGDDQLDGGDGADTLAGDEGTDILLGGAGSDDLSGGGGDDQLAGGAGSDSSHGGPGNDVIDGGAGRDTSNGGDGDDAIESERTDTVSGGNGTDACGGAQCELPAPANCTGDAQCAGGQRCLLSTGTCLGCLSEAACDDGDDCTADACEPVAGCVHTSITCDGPTFDVTCDARISEANQQPTFFTVVDSRRGLLVVEDPALASAPFQDDDGAIHVPIGYDGPLTLRFSARYTNDTASTLDLVNVRPYGFSHMLGESQLQYPNAGFTEQGAFTYQWTVPDALETVRLAAGENVTRSFFDYELIDAFGPTIPAIVTPWGFTTPEHDLVIGEESDFFCQILGDRIEYRDCLTDNGGCDENATCTSAGDGRTCACNAGFIGDGFVCTEAVCASNECDVTAPLLHAFSLSPAAIDTTGGAASVRATLEVTDDLSGIQFVQVRAHGPAGQFQSCYANAAPSGVPSATLACDVVFPAASAAGLWAIHVHLFDEVGNVRQLTDTALMAAGFPSSVSVESEQDVEAPTLVNFSLTPTLVDTSAAGTVRAVLEVADNLSGVQFAQVRAHGPAGQFQSCYAYPASSGQVAAMLACDVVFPPGSAAGTWSIHVHLFDEVANFRQLSDAELLAAGFPGSVVVESEQDVAGPELVAFSLAPSAIDTTSDAASVGAVLQVTDALSGIQFAQVRAHGPAGQFQSCYAYPASPGVAAATLSCSIVFPAFSASGSWDIHVHLFDQVGNVRLMTPGDLIALGFPAAVQIN